MEQFLVHFNQHDKSPVIPVSVGRRTSLSHLSNALKNSSELKLPSRFASNTWNMTLTTLSDTETPQTYHHNKGQSHCFNTRNLNGKLYSTENDRKNKNILLEGAKKIIIIPEAI